MNDTKIRPPSGDDRGLFAPPSSGLSRHSALVLGALGVVFGDIGTSPLYAMRQSVLAAGGDLPAPLAVMGALSLIFWSLIIVVTIKYVVFIMRADNNGEGGVMALAALAHRSPGLARRLKTVIGIAAVLWAWRCSTATAC